MARNTAETVFTGDAAGLLAAYQQVREANRKQEQQMRELKQAAREAHQQEQQDLREQARLQKQVADALKSIQTPLEQLKQKRSEYRSMLEQGLVTEQQYQRLLEQVGAEFQKAKQQTEEYREAIKAQEDAERRRNQEVQEGLQLMREVQTPLEKYRERVKLIEKAHEQGTIDAETYNRQLAKARTELDDTTRAGDKGAEVIKGFVGAFLGMEGVQTILQGVAAEMENLKKLAAGSLDANLQFAEAMFAAKDAFTADASMGDSDLEPRVKEIAGLTGTMPDVVAQGVPGIVAAKNKLSNELAFSVLEESYRLSPGDLETAMQNAPAALDLMNVTGVKDPRAALSFLDQISQNARVEGPQFVGKNLAPAIGGLTTYGDTLEQAAELTATLTSLSFDKTGERSRTALLGLADQLKKAFPKGGSTSERLAMLQADPKQAKKFLDTMTAEAGMRPYIESLVLGSDLAMETLTAKQAGITGISTPAERAAHQDRHEGKIAALTEGLGGQVRAAEQQAAANAAIAKIDNSGRTIAGQAQRRLDEFLDNTNTMGPDSLQVGIGPLSGDFGTDASARKQFAGRVAFGQDPSIAAIRTIENYRMGLSEEDKAFADKQIAILQRMADSLDRAGATPPPEAAQGR